MSHTSLGGHNFNGRGLPEARADGPFSGSYRQQSMRRLRQSGGATNLRHAGRDWACAQRHHAKAQKEQQSQCAHGEWRRDKRAQRVCWPVANILSSAYLLLSFQFICNGGRVWVYVAEPSCCFPRSCWTRVDQAILPELTAAASHASDYTSGGLPSETNLPGHKEWSLSSCQASAAACLCGTAAGANAARIRTCSALRQLKPTSHAYDIRFSAPKG